VQIGLNDADTGRLHFIWHTFRSQHHAAIPESARMNRFIEDRREELIRLCVRHHVSRLELLGSAVGEGFDAEHSDLDFIVEFDELGPGNYADAYFGLLEDFQVLFRRPVDLVMTKAIKNPYFLEAVNASRVVLYAA